MTSWHVWFLNLHSWQPVDLTHTKTWCLLKQWRLTGSSFLWRQHLQNLHTARTKSELVKMENWIGDNISPVTDHMLYTRAWGLEINSPTKPCFLHSDFNCLYGNRKMLHLRENGKHRKYGTLILFKRVRWVIFDAAWSYLIENTSPDTVHFWWEVDLINMNQFTLINKHCTTAIKKCSCLKFAYLKTYWHDTCYHTCPTYMNCAVMKEWRRAHNISLS